MQEQRQQLVAPEVLPREPGPQVVVPTVRLEVLPKSASIVVCVLEWARPNAAAVVTIPVLAERGDLEWVFPSGFRPAPWRPVEVRGHHWPWLPVSCVLGWVNPSAILQTADRQQAALLQARWRACP